MALKGPTVSTVLLRSVRAHALGGKAKDVVDAVRRAAGIYSSAPTCNLALLARTSGATEKAIDDATLKKRSLVRVHAMRGSIHLMPREWVPHALALGKMKPIAHYAELAGIQVRAYAPLTERIEKLLADEPLTATEIRDALGPKAPDGTGLSSVLGRMGREGRIVRAGARETAKGQTFEYALMSDWMDLPEERPS